MARLACFMGVLTWALVGCDLLDKKEKSADPDEGQAFSQPISALGGGTLATGSGRASLQIPAGALATDTTLTVEVEPKDADTAGNVYNYGPDGTTFIKPATLTLKYEGDVPSDQQPVLSTYSGGKWVAIAGSTFSGGEVKGSVAHFSKFSIILVGKDVVALSGCSNVAESFAACGGNVVGTYTITDVCFSNLYLGENPMADFCPSATIDLEAIWNGTITITSSTIQSNITSQTVTSTINIPSTCLAPYQMTCTAFQSQAQMSSCAESGGICSCTQTQTQTNDGPDAPEAYRVEGTNLITTDNTDQTTDSAPYCVEGNKLTAEFTEESNGKINKFYLVLTKQ